MLSSGASKEISGQVSAYYGIPQEHHHRALDDALTAARIYERLKEEYSEVYPELFEPSALNFKVKKASPITNSQKVYLRDLLKYHRINDNVKIEELTKSEASRMIDANYIKIWKDEKVKAMMNFHDSKTKQRIAAVIVILIVVAMVLGMLLPALY